MATTQAATRNNNRLWERIAFGLLLSSVLLVTSPAAEGAPAERVSFALSSSVWALPSWKQPGSLSLRSALQRGLSPSTAFSGFGRAPAAPSASAASPPPLVGLTAPLQSPGPGGFPRSRPLDPSQNVQGVDPTPEIEDESKTSARPRFRPTFEFRSEWLSRASRVQMITYDASVSLPLYPFFGPPPPSIRFGFSYTDFLTTRPELPTELYRYTLDASWLRPINDRWVLRFQFGTAIATDGKNMTSDAWRFRGMALAIYERSPEWTWVFGVVALGRSDLPAVPAVGVTWTPHPKVKVDLIMPRPRVSILVSERETRQQWIYSGIELGGDTWAVERPNGVDDELTYKDWRVVLGWETVPTPAPGRRFGRGPKLGVQIGYSFAREFEFDGRGPDIELSDALMVSARLSF